MRAHWIPIFVCVLSATTAVAAEPVKPSLIPMPQKMEISEGRFKLGPATRIVVDGPSAETGAYLAARLRASTGYPFPIQTNDEAGLDSIQITTQGASPSLDAEGYKLDVQPHASAAGIDEQPGHVLIVARTQAGAFYGVQTLLQLFPPQIFSTNVVKNIAWEIPFAVRIEDQPRFPWRGFMLDCSRHFFSKDEVKRVLDEMALHKLNTFHWHLTDDQGWRIEIKKYPKLTEIGAWREKSMMTPPGDEDGKRFVNHVHPAWDVAPPTDFGPDGRYGGFYSQDDVREIVAYAASRHITVVPEIEMPGHAIAALAAYPELSCDGGKYSTSANAGVNKGVFCVGKDEVFTFLDNVLLEVFDLFPGKYIHVGGDEVNAAVKKATWGQSPECLARMKAENLKTLDDLQGWFTGQIGKFVSAHGKVMIGWTEIADSPLPSNAAVMDWQGGVMLAATNGHDVVMSPTKFCYLDYYQSLDTAMEPPGIGGFLPLDKVYSFEPIPANLPTKFQSHVLGGQGNLWTEYVPSIQHVEYMMFPRLCALAEVDWSPKTGRDFNDFSQRLQIHEKRFDVLGITYRKELSVKIGEWTPAQLTTNEAGTNLEWDVTGKMNATGQYRVTFEHSKGPGLVITAVSLFHGNSKIAEDVHNGFAARNPTKAAYVLNVPQPIPDAHYTLRASVIGADSSGIVTVLPPSAKP
ncbi:MAG TPA: beta-N-acetylhexosaminidase [Verrucomicrobiae bacterium]|nr:beta-N-acetylhexosaminidase [Verrucomicrobiae bacterium]